MVARFSAPVQTSPEAHPASYAMATGSFSRGCDVNHPPAFSAEVKERVEIYLYFLIWACFRVDCIFFTRLTFMSKAAEFPRNVATQSAAMQCNHLNLWSTAFILLLRYRRLLCHSTAELSAKSFQANFAFGNRKVLHFLCYLKML